MDFIGIKQNIVILLFLPLIPKLLLSLLIVRLESERLLLIFEIFFNSFLLTSVTSHCFLSI